MKKARRGGAGLGKVDYQVLMNTDWTIVPELRVGYKQEFESVRRYLLDIGLPSRRLLTAQQIVRYEPIVEFQTRKARRNFERAALTAVETFLRARGEL